jgi:hypothetical protein
MKKRASHYFSMLLLVISLSLSGCILKSAPQSGSMTETPVSMTSTFTPIPPTSTVTSLPPTVTPTTLPSTVIRLSQVTNGSTAKPLLLEVVKGDYKITSGTTLTSGSMINANEKSLTFPPGLVIEIGKGGVTLLGVDCSEGTTYIVNANGTLVNQIDQSEIPLINATPENNPEASNSTPTSIFSGLAATTISKALTKTVTIGLPIIQSVILREDSSSGSKIIFQDISFIDNEGDVTRVDYEIVSSTISGLQVEGGDLDIPGSLQKSGSSFTGEWDCGSETYSVTLEITLTDKANNHSKPYRYTMVCGS